MEMTYRSIIQASVPAVLAVVLLLMPAPSEAGSIGDPLDMLGISGMSCSCSQTIGEGGNYWSFQSEPEILAVHDGGPADGKLKRGDIIVALNGMLITTRKAGVLFANLEPGEPVTLTVSRRGKTKDVTIVPEKPARKSSPWVKGFDSTGTWSIPDLSRSIEDLSMSLEDLQLPDITDIPDIPDLPVLYDLTRNLNFRFMNMQPKGWFGFGLSMSGSIKQEDDEVLVLWRFDSPPTVKTVEPNSPAEHAGLKEGDKLTHIDGVRIDTNKGGRRFSEVEPGDVVTWTYKRDGKSTDVEMKAEKRPKSLSRRYGMPSFRTTDTRKQLYSGQYGDTRVDVTGSDRVKVYTDPETGELVIETRDGTVRLQKADKNG
jgi:membrane-associated protease RseP (regulator of RpoE activity)